MYYVWDLCVFIVDYSIEVDFDTHGAHLLLMLELTFNVGLIVWNGGGLEVVCCILE